MSSKRDRRFVIRPDGRDKGEVFKFTTIDMVSGREVCTNEFVRAAERARYQAQLKLVQDETTQETEQLLEVVGLGLDEIESLKRKLAEKQKKIDQLEKEVETLKKKFSDLKKPCQTVQQPQSRPPSRPAPRTQPSARVVYRPSSPGSGGYSDW